MDTLLGALSTGLTGSTALALAAAFGWGLASLAFSPCHLAGIPLIVAFINGEPSMSSRRAGALAAAFGAGILTAIALVGVATAGAGRLAGDVGPWAAYLVAGLFLITGLSLLDVIPVTWTPPRVAGLRGRGALGAGALGLVFGLALGPCTFAFLVPVLGAAFAVGAHGAIGGTVLVLAFAAGHTLLIVLAGSSVNHVHRVLVATSRTRMQLWRHASGALVILGGLYVLYAA